MKQQLAAVSVLAAVLSAECFVLPPTLEPGVASSPLPRPSASCRSGNGCRSTCSVTGSSARNHQRVNPPRNIRRDRRGRVAGARIDVAGGSDTKSVVSGNSGGGGGATHRDSSHHNYYSSSSSSSSNSGSSGGGPRRVGNVSSSRGGLRPGLGPRDGESFEDKLSDINKWRRVSDDVRATITTALRNPKTLTPTQFLHMGKASGRHLDIGILTDVLDAATSVGIIPCVKFMTSVVNSAAKSHRWMMVSQILHQMRVMKIAPNEVTYTAILSEMAKARQYQLITDLIRAEPIKPTVDIYNAIISGCLVKNYKKGSTVGGGKMAADSFERAMSYFQDMRAAGVQPDAMTYSSLITACKSGHRDMLKNAKELFVLMQREGVTPTQYCLNSLMSVSNGAGHPDETLVIFESIRAFGVQRDLISYNTAIAACEKLGDGDRALQILEEAKLDPGVEPDVITYNTVMAALGRSNYAWLALDLLEDMKYKGPMPGTITYNTAILACARNAMVEEALAVFDEMHVNKVKKDKYTYAAALQACIKANKWERAIGMINAMTRRKMEVTILTLTSAIKTCAAAGRTDETVMLYERGLEMGLTPHEITYREMLDCCARQKRWKEGQRLLADMEKFGLRPDSGHLDAALLCCTEQADVVVSTLRRMGERRIKASRFTADIALEVCRAASAAAAASGGGGADMDHYADEVRALFADGHIKTGPKLPEIVMAVAAPKAKANGEVVTSSSAATTTAATAAAASTAATPPSATAAATTPSTSTTHAVAISPPTAVLPGTVWQ